jgi:hypothetical protein
LIEADQIWAGGAKERAQAPHLQRAHCAANKQIQHDGHETATVAWDDYCRAQGGIACGRGTAIKLTMRETETLGRYGDAAQPRPVGVETLGLSDFDGDSLAQQARRWQIESERRVWTIERAPVRRIDWRSFDAESAKPAQPRTRVNNCTGAEQRSSQGTQDHQVVRSNDPHYVVSLEAQLGRRNLKPSTN